MRVKLYRNYVRLLKSGCLEWFYRSGLSIDVHSLVGIWALALRSYAVALIWAVQISASILISLVGHSRIETPKYSNGTSIRDKVIYSTRILWSEAELDAGAKAEDTVLDGSGSFSGTRGRKRRVGFIRREACPNLYPLYKIQPDKISSSRDSAMQISPQCKFIFVHPTLVFINLHHASSKKKN